MHEDEQLVVRQGGEALVALRQSRGALEGLELGTDGVGIGGGGVGPREAPVRYEGPLEIAVEPLPVPDVAEKRDHAAASCAQSRVARITCMHSSSVSHHPFGMHTISAAS